MEWLFALGMVLLFVYLMINYTKGMLIILGSIFTILAVIALIVWLIHIEGTNLEKRVTASIKYDTRRCPEDFPLAVLFRNNTGKEVRYIRFRVEATHPGRSTNLVISNDGYYYYSDLIIKRRDTRLGCYTLPEYRSALHLPSTKAEMKYTANVTKVEFGE